MRLVLLSLCLVLLTGCAKDLPVTREQAADIIRQSSEFAEIKTEWFPEGEFVREVPVASKALLGVTDITCDGPQSCVAKYRWKWNRSEETETLEPVQEAEFRVLPAPQAKAAPPAHTVAELLNQAQRKAANRQFVDALAEADAALALKPAHAEYVYFVRGVVQTADGDDRAAETSFTEAIRIASDFADAYWQRGRARAHRGHTKEAEADYAAGRAHGQPHGYQWFRLRQFTDEEVNNAPRPFAPPAR